MSVISPMVFTGISKEAEDILASNPGSRNSNAKLILAFLNSRGLEIVQTEGTTGVSILKTLRSVVSIVRSARKIQNDFGLYPSTDKIKKLREEKAEEVSDWAVEDKKDDEGVYP